MNIQKYIKKLKDNRQIIPCGIINAKNNTIYLNGVIKKLNYFMSSSWGWIEIDGEKINCSNWNIFEQLHNKEEIIVLTKEQLSEINS
jgi:hypothetical protein